jgi:hypothetical protein
MAPRYVPRKASSRIWKVNGPFSPIEGLTCNLLHSSATHSNVSRHTSFQVSSPLLRLRAWSYVNCAIS